MILTQIEAKEACDWLKAAGFPQYAQMFADMQFPVDIKTVRKDHEFLDQDAIESLYRRLNTLNKYAEMKVEISKPRKRSDESEDEEPCAISNKWTYEKGSNGTDICNGNRNRNDTNTFHQAYEETLV
ncbi:rho GTPase-activating protein 7-like [Crotalus adamanteus]|uniref:Rho GTPase-activating protein 7-like n=1 Tax=Crotalus adamanteus TaxID=8729 RepID=A0AAW1BX93_CROAD